MGCKSGCSSQQLPGDGGFSGFIALGLEARLNKCSLLKTLQGN